MRIKILLLFLLTIMPLVSPVSAQEPNKIEYGQTIKGEITDEEYEIEYVFNGTENDTILIRMFQDGYDDALSEPEVLLTNAKNKVLASTADQFNLGSVLLAVRLTTTDTYKLIATRSDGRGGDKEGKFVLELIKPMILTPGVEVQGTVTNKQKVYYTIQADGPITISYTKRGDYSPALTINVIDDSTLTDVAQMYGKEMSSGTLTLTPKAKTAYIIRISEAPYDINFTEVKAEYSLSYTSVKAAQ